MSVFTPEVDDWIGQPGLTPRPTEILVPVTIHVGPVWAYLDVPPSGPRCWGAGLTVTNMPDAVLDECDHHHGTEDEAWACGEAMARALAERLTSWR